jgi:hypothetical protein
MFARRSVIEDYGQTRCCAAQSQRAEKVDAEEG